MDMTPDGRLKGSGGIVIPTAEATDRQILIAILESQDGIHRMLRRLYAMAVDASAALAELVTAVDEVGTRFAELAASLPQALADRDAAQAALAVAQANDATDAATIASLEAAAATADASVQTVVDSITAQTARLNLLGTPVQV